MPPFVENGKPCLAINRDLYSGFLLVTMENAQGLFFNDYGCLGWLLACEGEMVDGVELVRVLSLKGQRETCQEALYRLWR